MRGIIDSKGKLLIEREGTLQYQFCPFSTSEELCGDWSPHFGEPMINQPYITNGEHRESASWLVICQGKTIFFETLTKEKRR